MSRTAFEQSVVKMTEAVHALPRARQEEAFSLLAAHLNTVTTQVAGLPRRGRTARKEPAAA